MGKTIIMQRTTIYIFLLLSAGCAFMSCEREDFRETTDIPGEAAPTEIEFEEGFALRAQDETVFLADGSAKRFVGSTSTMFAITSGTIICDGAFGYNLEHTGSNAFILQFLEIEGNYYTNFVSLTAEVDGAPRLLFSLVPQGSGCQQQPREITITSLTDDHISGSLTGSFFSLDGATSPDLPCSGFTYVGEFTASFSLAYEDCE